MIGLNQVTSSLRHSCLYVCVDPSEPSLEYMPPAQGRYINKTALMCTGRKGLDLTPHPEDLPMLWTSVDDG